MESERERVEKHVAAALAETDAAGIPRDVVGRLLLDAVCELWLAERSHEDVAAELVSTAENLDPDVDHIFMRP